MAHTVEAARKKWCPFARVPDSNGGGVGLVATNRHAGEKKRGDGKVSILRSNSMCIASQCMAWRWADISGEHSRRGYCGIAGPDTATTPDVSRET